MGAYFPGLFGEYRLFLLRAAANGRQYTEDKHAYTHTHTHTDDVLHTSRERGVCFVAARLSVGVGRVFFGLVRTSSRVYFSRHWSGYRLRKFHNDECKQTQLAARARESRGGAHGLSLYRWCGAAAAAASAAAAVHERGGCDVVVDRQLSSPVV